MDNSPFGHIPAELRITIYEYALTFDRLSCRLRPSDQSEPSLSTQLALTQVCRHIRAESGHMPFALNNPVAEHVPCLCIDRGSQWVETAVTSHREARETIKCTPTSLVTDVTTFSFDMHCWDRQLSNLGTVSSMAKFHWANLKFIFGNLIHVTQQEKFVLDFTPRRKCDIGRLWCEVDYANPVFTSQSTSFGVDVVLDKDASGAHARTERDDRLARIDSAGVLAVMHKHRTHERSLCNVTKRGEAFMARLAQLEHDADDVIARRRGSWRSVHGLSRMYDA
jgi:hypothetical protein